MTLNRRTVKLGTLVHAQVKSSSCTFNVFCARKQFAHVYLCDLIGETCPCILTVYRALQLILF